MAFSEEPFCLKSPSPQTAVDLFAGQWASQLPPPFEKLTGGTSELFDDDRITWGTAELGGVVDSRILELGPLEGGHTFMLDRHGAAQVTAIEENTRAFLRCLVVKEILGMPSAHFLCGDFVPFLSDAIERRERWDLCLALGVLSHQQDPVALLELVTQVSDRVLLFTHYYDAELQARFRSTLREDHRWLRPHPLSARLRRHGRLAGVLWWPQSVDIVVDPIRHSGRARPFWIRRCRCHRRSQPSERSGVLCSHPATLTAASPQV
jgi:hypothetical protein